jgi:O-antigen biosynthesis protein WbqP
LIEARQRLGVLDLRPGITGIAQVRGVDMSLPQLLAETDAEYLSRCGFIEDLRLIMMTAFGAGRGDAIK